MSENSRKRRFPYMRESDPVENPSKQRKVDCSLIKGSEGHIESVTKHIKGFFSWLCDIPSKNYFIDSAMAAIKSRGSVFMKKKSDFDTSPQAGEIKEENSENPPRPVRYKDLKRVPLRDTFEEAKSRLNNQPSRASNSSPEEKNYQVIKHPFKSTRSFHQNGQLTNKTKDLKNGHSHRSLPSSSSKLSKLRSASNGNDKTEGKHPSHFSEFKKQHLPGGSFYKRNAFTTQEVLDLRERDQYKVLLEQFTRFPIRNSTVLQKSLSPKGAQAEASVPPPFMKRQLPPSELQIFLNKYVKEPKLCISPFCADTSIEYLNALAKIPVPTPVQQKSAIEDDVVITGIKLPSPRSTHFDNSKFFNPEWIENLRQSLQESDRKLIVQQELKKIEEFKRQRTARAEKEAQNQYRLSGAVLPETIELESDVSIEFPKLTPKMEDRIDDALTPDPPEEVLCVGFNTQVKRKDFETLAGLNWLNDEIIYFYINLLMERSKLPNYPSVYAFNTFFYPKLLNGGHSALKRWTRKIDVFSYDLILVPVHIRMHWCLAVIDFRHKTIQYYDSMGGQNDECLYALRDYLMDECRDKKKEEFCMRDWCYKNVKNIPHQMNGSDCGMFALKYAEFLTRDAEINFTQENMHYYRRRMVYEILTKKLL